MKKKLIIFCIISISILASLYFYLKPTPTKYTNSNIDKYDIVILETSTFNKSSYLNEYSFNGNKINQLEVNCPDLKSSYAPPATYDAKWYVPSLGGYSNRSKNVVEFIPLENKFNLYEIHFGIVSVASNNDYIFAVHNPSKNSALIKYNKTEKSTESTLTIKGRSSHIKMYNNKLYVFGDSDNKDGNSIISIVNPETMTLEKEIEQKYGLSSNDSFYFNDNIYITHLRDIDDNAPSKSISKLNLKDYSITNINLNEDAPKQIKEYKGSLYISHFNDLTQNGKTLTIFNPTTNQMDKKVFVHNLKQIEIKDNKLIATDSENLYIYNADTFELINKFEIKSKKEGYRITGFFLKE